MENNIWLPGVGTVPPHIRTAQRAIESYDPALELGFDERHQTWVVLWKDGPGGQAFPVFGLGRELPGFDEIQRMLYSADVRRQGRDFIRQLKRRREQQLRDSRREVNEAAGEAAEEIEHAFRRMGETSYKKVYLPGIALPA